LKILILFVLFCGFSMEMQSQITYAFSQRKRLEFVKYNVSDSENVTILFNKSGQINKIERRMNTKLHGFVYYFTNNKLDSIEVYNTGIKTPEMYLMHKAGYLKKHVLCKGENLDSFFSFTHRKNITGKTSKHWINMQKMYETDSNGVLSRIYDTDNGNYATGYDVCIPDGYYFYSIYNQQCSEGVSFSNGYISGFHTYKNSILHGVRILLNGNKKTNLVQLDITAANQPIFETTYFNRRGKKINHRPWF